MPYKLRAHKITRAGCTAMSRREGQWVPKDFKELRGQMTETNKPIGYSEENRREQTGRGLLYRDLGGSCGQGSANTRLEGKNRKEAALFYIPGVSIVLFLETWKKFC